MAGLYEPQTGYGGEPLALAPSSSSVQAMATNQKEGRACDVRSSPSDEITPSRNSASLCSFSLIVVGELRYLS